jgi:hypothetical protein
MNPNDKLFNGWKRRITSRRNLTSSRTGRRAKAGTKATTQRNRSVDWGEVRLIFNRAQAADDLVVLAPEVLSCADRGLKVPEATRQRIHAAIARYNGYETTSDSRDEAGES